MIKKKLLVGLIKILQMGEIKMKLTVGNIILTIIVVVASLSVVSLIMTTQTISVEGKIINTLLTDNYIEIFFENGEHYKITYPDDAIDLSKGSKIVLHLQNTNWFWIDDGIWETESIIKI